MKYENIEGIYKCSLADLGLVEESRRFVNKYSHEKGLHIDTIISDEESRRRVLENQLRSKMCRFIIEISDIKYEALGHDLFEGLRDLEQKSESFKARLPSKKTRKDNKRKSNPLTEDWIHRSMDIAEKLLGSVSLTHEYYCLKACLASKFLCEVNISSPSFSLSNTLEVSSNYSTILRISRKHTKVSLIAFEKHKLSNLEGI